MRPHRAFPQAFRVGRGMALAVGVTVMLVGMAPVALADGTGTIDFEAPAYATGTIHNQNGWSSAGAAGSGCAVYDHEVDGSSGVTGFGSQSLRMSNAVTSGCFGDQTFSKSVVDEAGETSAEGGGLSGGTRQPVFEASWQFASTVPGAEQAGLSVVASPDRGDGARMSWIQMADTPTGLAVNFYDYQAGVDDFVFTNAASGLDRNVPHSIRVVMSFVDGPANDVVQVFVDGALRHTGTSWEDYFRDIEGNPTRTVDSILFRTGGTAAPATAGNGFLVDNLVIATGAYPVSSMAPCLGVVEPPATYRLITDCVTDHTVSIPDGWTLDGNGHSITAVDPTADHFRGAVVRNAGSMAHVVNLTVTASGLDDVCDGGNDRLRGILFDGAGGSIVDSTVSGVRQGLSGCQEGNAIEVRNEPFTTAGPDVSVLIDGNTVSDFQKNGITANGSVAATITGNTVVGDGPIGYIAQNGIQVAFGATATVRGNSISGNYYPAKSWVACGLLIYQADGVRASSNAYSGNEKDVCNFGKGGGQFNPGN